MTSRDVEGSLENALMADRMRNSKLKKKSAAFRQGYNTGRHHADNGMYDKGFEDGKREATDLTLAGIIMIGLIAGAVGFWLGLVVGFQPI